MATLADQFPLEPTSKQGLGPSYPPRNAPLNPSQVLTDSKGNSCSDTSHHRFISSASLSSMVEREQCMPLGGVSLLPHCVCGGSSILCLQSTRVPLHCHIVVHYTYQDSWGWVPGQLSLWDYCKYNFEVPLIPPFGDLVCTVPLSSGF